MVKFPNGRKIDIAPENLPDTPAVNTYEIHLYYSHQHV